MFNENRNLTYWVSVVIGVCFLATYDLPAFATCRDVSISIHNKTNDEIKVKRFEYLYASNNWHTEHMFGVDGFQKLLPGKSMSWVRTLDGAPSFYRLTYAHHIGGSKWNSDRILNEETRDPCTPVNLTIEH